MENSTKTTNIGTTILSHESIPEFLRVTFTILYPNGLTCDNICKNLNNLNDAINEMKYLINSLDEDMRNEPFIFYINYFSANYEKYDDFPVTTLYDFYNSFVSYLYALEHNTVPVKNTIQ